MTWGPREEGLHPRDAEGQFTEKWAGRVSDAFGGIPTYHPTSHIPPKVEHDYRQALTEELRVAHETDEPGYNPSQEAYDRKSRFYDAQTELRRSGATAADMERLHRDVQHDYYRDWYRRRNHPDMTTEQLHQAAAGWAKQAFADRQVAVRVTPAGLAKILEQGRFKTVHEPDARSRGLNDAQTRALHEQITWGYEPGSDPAARPVYGYLAGPERHAGKDEWDDSLSQYGRIEVRLRDSVRGRTTAMFGDSLDTKHTGYPSRVNNPDGWAWNYANPGGIVTSWMSGPDRSALDAFGYIEAQVHGGVQVGDIERVVFPSAPSAALKAALEARGIPWKVVKP